MKTKTIVVTITVDAEDLADALESLDADLNADAFPTCIFGTTTRDSTPHEEQEWVENYADGDDDAQD
jgi:hypothetical protein